MTASNATHQLTIATLGRGLRNTAAIMDKAEAHAKSHGIALETLLQSRLFPDMFTLLQQLQYVCYLSVDFARHFSATEAPRVGYDEATWGELRNSLDEAARYLDGIPRARLNDASTKMLPPFMDDSKRTNAITYASEVILPDFHFHMAIAYALLRKDGVPLGKSDFLGALSFKAA